MGIQLADPLIDVLHQNAVGTGHLIHEAVDLSGNLLQFDVQLVDNRVLLPICRLGRDIVLLDVILHALQHICFNNVGEQLTGSHTAMCAYPVNTA